MKFKEQTKQVIEELNKNSIELSRNAKGVFSYKLKVYFDSIEDGLNKLKLLHNRTMEFMREQEK